MTNLEGRVTLREASMPPLGEAKHDWQIICEIAHALGKGNYFSFSRAEEIFNELRVASRGGLADYYGITYERLKHGNGIVWPCPSLDHHGTERLFEKTFAHHDGKANMEVITNIPAVLKEQPCEEYPLYLTTGRVLSHYLTGVQTRKSHSLHARQFESFVEIHPETAEKFGIPDNTLVKLESRIGCIVVRSKWSKAIRPDTVFVPFHWGDTQNVNLLVSGTLDPICKMPGFKVSAVKITPVVLGNEVSIFLLKRMSEELTQSNLDTVNNGKVSSQPRSKGENSQWRRESWFFSAMEWQVSKPLKKSSTAQSQNLKSPYSEVNNIQITIESYYQRCFRGIQE